MKVSDFSPKELFDECRGCISKAWEEIDTYTITKVAKTAKIILVGMAGISAICAKAAYDKKEYGKAICWGLAALAQFSITVFIFASVAVGVILGSLKLSPLLLALYILFAVLVVLQEVAIFRVANFYAKFTSQGKEANDRNINRG